MYVDIGVPTSEEKTSDNLSYVLNSVLGEFRLLGVKIVKYNVRAEFSLPQSKSSLTQCQSMIGADYVGIMGHIQ